MSSPFDLPTDLKQWDYETVYRLVSGEAYEPGIFDFKELLKARGSEEGEKEHIKNIRKVIGSMANTNTGGFIIFGVLDRLKHPNKTTKGKIVGIEDGDLRKEFDDKQKESIHPHVYFETCPKLIDIPDVQGKGVFVVRIPPSPRRPHMVTIEERTVGKVNIFYRRGDGGTAIPMSYYEVRDQMMFTEERLRKVTLLRLEITQYQEIITEMLAIGPYVVVTRYRFDTGAFKVLLADICSLIPPTTDILRKLLRIPMQANTINQSIYPAAFANEQDVAAEQASFTRQTKEIRKNLENLRELCALCESDLTKIFGPLEGDNL